MTLNYISNFGRRQQAFFQAQQLVRNDSKLRTIGSRKQALFQGQQHVRNDLKL